MGSLLGVQQFAPATLAASRPCGGQAGLGPFPDQCPFELRKRAENMEDQLPAGTIRVDVILQTSQSYALLVQCLGTLDQILE